MLDRINELVTKLQNTSSGNEKATILKEYEDIKNILATIYDPKILFYITSDSLVSDNFSTINTFDNIAELLNVLSSGKKRGTEAINLVCAFINSNKKYEELIKNIIDKDLKCGVGVSIINNVWKNLIPEFEVALGNKYESESDIDWNSEYLVSRKLDGCRNVTFYKDGNVRFFSRQGNEFEVLDSLKEQISEIAKENNLNEFILDGEICWVEGDTESFSEIMKHIRRKNYTIPSDNIKYYVFDVLTVEEFNSHTSKVKLSERLNRIKMIENSRVVFVEQKILTPDVFAEMSKQVEENGWEGLILRKNTLYKGKRSKDILKVKKFHDQEFVVTEIKSEKISKIVEGKTTFVEMLSNITIDFNGESVGIGSGFTQEERIYFWNNPEKIVGHKVTIKYFEITTDKFGKKSLRFPIFKGVRDELI